MRNADTLYAWNLENVRDTPLQLVSPFRFTEGETVTLQLTCSGPGDSSTNQCSVAATLSGSLRQA